MIQKSGKDLKNLSSHLNIALINSMAEVMEIIILIQKIKVVPTSIQPDQYALSPQHFLINQLTKVIDHLANTTNRKERTSAVFLDFNKMW